MIHLCLTRKTVAFFIGIAVVLFIVVWETHAQEGTLTTFSGRVMDETGNPIAGCAVAIVPVSEGNGAWFPIQEPNVPIEGPLPFHAESDAEGRFTIATANEGQVLLTRFPVHNNSGTRILKVQIGGLFFYPSGIWESGIVFATSPGRHIANIEVTIQQPHIRGRLQRVDGTPIPSAPIRLRLRGVGLRGDSSGSYGGIRTDAEGYFSHYVNEHLGGPAFYMLSVAYQGQTVSAKPILRKPGDQTHEVIFTFDDGPASPLRAQRGRSASASASTKDARPIATASLEEVWVVRPENSHAYKRIRCADWEDAQTQAAAERAYLVTINDETEQKWLQAVFGGQPSWIGLNDIAEEGQWVWDNGEPLTYTNWGLQEPDDTSIGDEDYVIFGTSGKWKDFGPGHGGISLIRTALIEKNRMDAK